MQTESALEQMRELQAIALAYVKGESEHTLHDGWGVAEHEAYWRAMNDAISIVESNTQHG